MVSGRAASKHFSSRIEQDSGPSRATPSRPVLTKPALSGFRSSAPGIPMEDNEFDNGVMGSPLKARQRVDSDHASVPSRMRSAPRSRHGSRVVPQVAWKDEVADDGEGGALARASDSAKPRTLSGVRPLHSKDAYASLSLSRNKQIQGLSESGSARRGAGDALPRRKSAAVSPRDVEQASEGQQPEEREEQPPRSSSRKRSGKTPSALTADSEGSNRRGVFKAIKSFTSASLSRRALPDASPKTPSPSPLVYFKEFGEVRALLGAETGKRGRET